MRTTKGECKINGLHVTEVSIKNLTPLQSTFSAEEPREDQIPTNAVMEAVYATVEAKDERALGRRLSVTNTHGRCTAVPQNWSKNTLQLLADLLESMEQDLIPRHFKESAEMEAENAGLEPGADEEAHQV